MVPGKVATMLLSRERAGRWQGGRGLVFPGKYLLIVLHSTDVTLTLLTKSSIVQGRSAATWASEQMKTRGDS